MTLAFILQTDINQIFSKNITYFQVIEWADHHKNDPPAPEEDENKEKRTDDISSWDSTFLQVDQGTLFELILAANYLDIKVCT